MAASSTPGVSDPELSLRTYEALLASGLVPNRYIEALLQRDHIQLLLKEGRLSATDLQRVQATDDLLRDCTARLGRAGEKQKKSVRESVLPPAENWWWHPHQEPLIWNVIAVLMLAVTGALATDFTARILTKNPDAWGVSAVVLQGLLTLAAGGTFTSAGKAFLAKLGLSGMAAAARACLAAILAIGVASLWYVLPGKLAAYYNNTGLHVCPNNLNCADVNVAIRMFERASNLDPEDATVHFNFGRVYELAFDYDKAIQQYQLAVADDFKSPAAMSNWARLLLIQKKDPTLPLALLDEAVIQARSRGIDKYPAAPAIFKNRGLANFQAGFYSQAEGDLHQSITLAPDAAAPHCLLAMVEDKLGQSDVALKEAQSCVSLNSTSILQLKGAAPKVDADAIRFAEKLLAKLEEK